MNPKLLSYLGLCQRAGLLQSGEALSEGLIRNGEATLIVLADDASKNTIKKFRNSAAYYDLPLLWAGTKAQLGKALGKEERAVAVVTDQGFTQKIMALPDVNLDT